MKSFRSVVFQEAHQIRRTVKLDWSTCLQLAWRRYRVVRDLHKGASWIVFTKKDGSIRQAYATLVRSYFPGYQFKTDEVSTNPMVVKYWDIMSEGWRSFRIERLIENWGGE